MSGEDGSEGASARGSAGAADEAARAEPAASGAAAAEAAAPGARSASLSGIAGVIFDCDGVLVDSEQPWLDLMGRYLREMGAAGVPAEAMRGMTAAEAVAALRQAMDRRTVARSGVPGSGQAGIQDLGRSGNRDSGQTGPQGAGLPEGDGLPQRGHPERTAPPTAAEVDRAYSGALAGLAAPMPGAPEFVRTLAGTIPVAVASNGRREDVRGLLERAGMLELFQAIVTIDDVERGKPEPDPYLLAIQRLGITPGTAVAFEDSVLGSQAARAAGCTVVGVNEDPSLPLVADIRLGSLHELRFEAASRSLHVHHRD